MIFKGKNFLILGLSASGAYSAAVLRRRGANIFLYDEDTTLCAIKCSKFGACNVSNKSAKNILEKIYCVVVSPGFKPNHKLLELARLKDISIIGEIELGYILYKGVTIGISGTNGKSTTTSLLHHILSSSGENSYLCGNIGTPFTAYSEKDYDSVCCTELSSFQLYYTESFKPHISAILNISPDHIDWHGNMDEYISAKTKIFKNQSKSEYTVLNFDCPYCRTFFECTTSEVLWFSTKQKVNGAYSENGKIFLLGEEICQIKDLIIKGEHNAANALAAVCMAHCYGIENKKIAAALKTFNGVEHRLQNIGTHNNITFINDSKATNVLSTIMALKSIEAPTIIILGGSNKKCSYIPLIKEIKQNQNIKKCILYGLAGKKIESCANSKEFLNYIYTEKFNDALNLAYNQCDSGYNLLLSPSCASYDQFKNFEERGNAFKNFLEQLKNEES